ncbi:hypothetical protein [Sanxia picorna-like virus 10]|uniref:hypothetical protein n=1 Tax=Sanxia picorna-like virus 10 TaxID=1923367 RepID=UPI00090C7554|nr:hypothetical protein [Sanxia picorna-like virus 10]APG77476.1 hypothetical protein [Sanxia picorna-like virus 10]
MFVPMQPESKPVAYRRKRFAKDGRTPTSRNVGDNSSPPISQVLPPIEGSMPKPLDFFLDGPKRDPKLDTNAEFPHELGEALGTSLIEQQAHEADCDSHCSSLSPQLDELEDISVFLPANAMTGYPGPKEELREEASRSKFFFNATIVFFLLYYSLRDFAVSTFCSAYVRSLPRRVVLVIVLPYLFIPFSPPSFVWAVPYIQVAILLHFKLRKDVYFEAKIAACGKVPANHIDDLSLAGTLATSSSSIESDPFLEMVLDTSSAPTKRVGALATFYEVLGEHSSAKTLAYFLSGLFTAPSYKTDPVKCVIFHTRNFSSLFTDLKTNYGSRISQLLDIIENEFQNMFQMCFWGESSSDEAQPHETWMSLFAEGFEKLERFQETPMGAVLSAGVSLISSLPIMISKCYTAENWVKQWKILCAAFKTTGGSLSTILKSFLAVHHSVVQTDSCWGSSSILGRILDCTPFYKEYALCRERFRKASLGVISLDSVTAESFLHRLARLEKMATNRLTSNSSAYDISIAKDCTELYSSMVTWVMRNTSRTVPFTIFYDGVPGTGKSTLVETIDKSLHAWRGISDIRDTAVISLDGKTDEITTNRTTSIIIDDYGNKKGPARQSGTSLTNFCIGNMNSTYMSVLKADLPDKGKHVYRNTFLHVIDNDAHRGVSEDLRCEFAFKRRAENSVEIKCRPEFSNPSGGLDLAAARNTTGYGEHLLFRPYSWEKIGNETPNMKNVFNGDGFVGHAAFYEWLKSTMVRHFELQESMLKRKADSAKLPLCNVCGILPHMYCACGAEDHCFLDAHCESVFEALTFSPSVQGYLDMITVRIRLYSASTNSFFVRSYAWIMEAPVVHVAFSFSAVLVWYLLQQGYREASFVVLVLFSWLVYVVSKLKRAWARYRMLALDELLESHTAFLRRHSTRFGMLMAALSVLIAAPRVLNAIISILPDKGVHPQTAMLSKPRHDGDSVLTEQQDVKPEPIWRKVVRVPVISDPKARTITESDLMRLCQLNTLKVRVRQPSTGETMPVYLFFISSEIAVTVAHAFVFDSKVGPVDILVDGRKPLPVQTHRMYISSGKDLMFLYLGDFFSQKRNLSSYLAMNAPPKQVLLKMVPNSGGWETERIESVFIDTDYNLSSVQGVVFQKQGVYRSIGHSLETGVGQCGLPYVGGSTSRTIASIHVAGNKHTTSYSLPILKCDYDLAVQQLTATGFKYPLHVNPYAMQSGKASPESEPDPKHPVHFLQGEGEEIRVEKWVLKNFTPISSIRLNPYLSSAIKHLGLRLHKDKPVMKIRQSAHKVLTSLTEDKQFGNVDLMVAASRLFIEQYVVPVLADVSVEEHMRSPLSMSQVLNGIPGFVPSVCLSTSSGIGGDKSLYVEGEVGARKLVPSMEQDVENIMQILKDGGNPWIPAVACLKDEARPPGKLQRLFYNPVMPQFLILSQYLRVPLDVITSNPQVFSTAIGLDPVGEEWEKVVEKFSSPEFRENCFDLDYEAFDTNQSEFMRNLVDNVFLEIASSLWSDKEHLFMLKKILSWANDTPVDMIGAVMSLKWLMLSGLLFTAHKNGLVTLHVVAADFIRFWKSKGKDPFSMSMNDYVRVVTLGDDTVASVSDVMRDCGWTQEHLVATASGYGLKLTTAAKDHDFKFKSYTQCEFLKRYYSYNSDLQRNVGVLSPKSYLQPFHTYTPSKEMTLEEYQFQQAETVLLEAMYDGRLLFEEWKTRLRNYFQETPFAIPHCVEWSYDALIESRSSSQRQKQLFPIENKGLALLREYTLEGPTVVEKRHIFRAESEPTERVGIHTLEGEVQDDAGYTNVNAVASRLPLDTITQPESILHRRQILRVVQLPLANVESFCPMLEMASQTIFRTRANHTAFRATGIKLTFVTSCPSTVSGCLIAAVVLPMYDDLSTAAAISTKSMNGMSLLSQLQHVIIRLGETSNVWHLTVPFISPNHAETTYDDVPSDKPMLYMVPIVPVTTSAADGPTITIRIYGEFEGLKLFGATAAVNPSRAFGQSQPESQVKHTWSLTEDHVDSENIDSCLESCRIEWSTFEANNPWTASDPVIPPLPHVTPEEPGYCYLHGFPPHLRDLASAYLGAFPLGCQILTCPVTEPLLLCFAFSVSGWPTLKCRQFSRNVFHVYPSSSSSLTLVDICWLHFNRKLGMDGAIGAQEKLSTRVLKVSNLVRQIGEEMPLLNLNRPSEVVRMVGNALERFGFSKPITASATRPSLFFPNAAGEDSADVLAVDPNCEVAPGLPTSIEDEMTFAAVSRKWTFVSLLAIPPSAPKGTEIYHINVTPHILVEGRPACCAAPGLFHELWRGSMEYKLEIYAPMLISVRLGVFFDPLGPNTPELLGGIREEVEDFQENVILDSSAMQVCEFCVGYSSCIPSLKVAPAQELQTIAQHNAWFSSASSYSMTGHNGHLKIRVIDYVNGGAAASMPIYAMLWARAGSDMQWGCYTGTLPMGLKISPPFIGDLITVLDDPCTQVPLTLVPPCGESQPPISVPAPSSQTPVPAPVVAQTQAPTKSSFFPTLFGGAPSAAPAASTPAPTQKAPTGVPTKATSAPSARPSSAKPSTSPSFRPSTSVPTTMKPSTGMPTSGKPTPIICPTGYTLESVYGRGFWISPQSWSKADGTLSAHSIEYIGLGDDTPQILRIGSYCAESGFYFRVPISAIAEEAWTLIDGNDTVNLDSLASVQSLPSPDPLYRGGYYAVNKVPIGPVPEIQQFGLKNNVAGSKLYIERTRMGGVPAGYAWSHWTIDDPYPEVPHCWVYSSLHPEANGGKTPATIVTINGMRASGPTTPTKITIRLRDWFGWLSVPFGLDDKYLIQIMFKGTISIPEANNWSQSKPTIQEALLVVPLKFGIVCSAENPIFRISVLSPWDPSSGNPRLGDWVDQNAFPKAGRRLKEDAFFAETGEISPSENVSTVKTHHFGAGLDNSEFFVRMLVGEQSLSFRPLLKIPNLVATIEPPSQGAFWVASEVPQSSIEGNVTRSLFGFLSGMFLAWRGGFIYHYVVYGNGAVEISRVTRDQTGLDYKVSSTARGIAFADSRVCPRVSVKIPWQESTMFAYSGFDSFTPINMLKVVKIDQGFCQVKEFRSTAEDFSFHYFRGMPSFVP